MIKPRKTGYYNKTISVSFRKEDIELVDAAATQLALTFSTFMRSAAVQKAHELMGDKLE